MNLNPTLSPTARRPRLAFTLVEVCISIAILAVMIVSLYAGMSSSFAITQTSRENLRATQIMLERMEGIRLYNWDQLVYSNMIPATFTNYYYPLAASGESKGTTYVGSMVVTNAVMNPAATYSTNMRAITVTVYWTNYNGYDLTKQIVRSRSMTTYSSRDGVQNYVYSN
jgi:type II secretory pathway pseudopilin PulG